jgi:hypothetical protein
MQHLQKNSAGNIPELNSPVEVTRGQTASVRREADRKAARGSLRKRSESVAPALLPQVTPFPASKILLARRGPVSIQQAPRASEVVQLHRLLRQIHVGCVEQSPGLMFVLPGFGGVRLGQTALRGFVRAGLLGALPLFNLCLASGVGFQATRVGIRPGQAFAKQAHRCQTQPAEYREHDCRRGGKRDLVSPDKLLESICRAGRAGDDRFMAQVPLEVHHQAIGRFVTARPVLLQTLHHDPVQIPLELVQQLRRVG